MGRIEFPVLLRLITTEYQRLSPVDGFERLTGAQAELQSFMGDFAQAIEDIRGIVADNPAEYWWAITRLASNTMEMMSVLFSVGAAPPAWRRWAGLTSVAYYAIDQRLWCAEYAALAGEWELLAHVDRSPIKTGDGGGRIFWELIGGQGPLELVYRDEPFDTAWRCLQASIPRRDHEQTETALQVIANYWISQSEGSWEAYRPTDHPNFEHVINAVAALARHQGFTPTKLSSDARRFLEAGLASEEPETFVPRVVRI